MPPTSNQPRLPHLPTQGGADKLGKEAKEPLQIRIPTSIKRRFKAFAAMQGKEPNELFVEVWESFERAQVPPSAAGPGEE